MSACNFCVLESIRTRAKRDGLKVTVTFGNNVFVHPKDVKITKDNRDEYFSAWLMEIPSACCC